MGQTQGKTKRPFWFGLLLVFLLLVGFLVFLLQVESGLTEITVRDAVTLKPIPQAAVIYTVNPFTNYTVQATANAEGKVKIRTDPRTYREQLWAKTKKISEKVWKRKPEPPMKGLLTVQWMDTGKTNQGFSMMPVGSFYIKTLDIQIRPFDAQNIAVNFSINASSLALPPKPRWLTCRLSGADQYHNVEVFLAPTTGLVGFQSGRLFSYTIPLQPDGTFKIPHNSGQQMGFTLTCDEGYVFEKGPLTKPVTITKLTPWAQVRGKLVNAPREPYDPLLSMPRLDMIYVGEPGSRTNGLMFSGEVIQLKNGTDIDVRRLVPGKYIVTYMSRSGGIWQTQPELKPGTNQVAWDIRSKP